jgi:hypothetical protein
MECLPQSLGELRKRKVNDGSGFDGFCGSPGACNRKQRKNWKNEGRGRLGMGRFVMGFCIYWLDVSLMINEVSSITSWKVDRSEDQ